MKKYIPFFVALCLFAMIGCGDNAGESGTTTGTESTSETTATDTTTAEEIAPVEEVVEEVVEEATEEMKDGAIVRITEGLIDPYRVLLALNTAEKLAADHKVLVYFDMRSTDVVLKDAPPASYSPFTDSDKQITKLNGMGVAIRACGSCLEANWKKPEDLTAGVKVLDFAELSEYSEGNNVSMTY